MFSHQRAPIEALSDEDAGQGLKQALRYFDGEPVDLSELSQGARVAFLTMKQYIDEAKADYEAAVKNGCKGAGKRWAHKKE